MGVFSFGDFIASVFFLDFGGQKSKKIAFLDFLFWAPSGFLSGLGGFWGVNQWISGTFIQFLGQ